MKCAIGSRGPSRDPLNLRWKNCHFASIPGRDPDAAWGLLARSYKESPHISSEVSTWQEFQHSIKATNHGHAWITYHLICLHTYLKVLIGFRPTSSSRYGRGGHLYTSLIDTCISLLYKKGDPTDASNCCPIAVSG